MMLYKVGNKNGLFSGGGSKWNFGAGGKFWKHKGHIKSFLLNAFGEEGVVPDDWEIIEYELIEKSRTSVKDLYFNYMKERVTKKLKRQIQEKMSHKEYLKREIRKMQQELEEQ